MKKFIFMMFAMLTMALGASAQYAVDGHRFFDNWSVGVNGGVQSNLHDWNAPQGAVTSVILTKSITPVFSLGFEGQVGWNNMANWNHAFDCSHVHNGNVVDNVGVFAVGNVNLMNWWGGYKGSPRLFEVVPFAGVGYGHTFMNEAYGSDQNHILAKAGTSLDFNLGKTRAWTINLRPSVVYNVAGGNSGNGFDCRNAVFEATAGLTYHFKTSNGKHHFTNVIIPEPIVKEVVKEVPVEVVKEVVKEVEVVKSVKSVATNAEKIIIGFAFDSAELSFEAKDTLTELAKNYGSASVVAFASFEDKTSTTYNVVLSEKRAKVIADFLRERGVTVIKEVGLGSVNKESNRIAIVEFN